MEIKKHLAILSILITLFLLTTVILTGNFMNNKREDTINSEFEKISRDFNNMQTLSLIADSYKPKMACLALESKLKEMDEYVWDLGEKIDSYRIASEEFQKDEYYRKQKSIFNEDEIQYYLLMNKMIKMCNITKKPILFFYQNSKTCKKCDDQSFVLSDINQLDDKQANNEIAIFSFDMDLNVSSLNIFKEYYNITRYPCIITNNHKLCGMHDKDYIVNIICKENPQLKLCSL